MISIDSQKVFPLNTSTDQIHISTYDAVSPTHQPSGIARPLQQFQPRPLMQGMGFMGTGGFGGQSPYGPVRMQEPYSDAQDVASEPGDENDADVDAKGKKRGKTEKKEDTKYGGL